MSAGQDPVAVARIMENDAVRRKLEMDQMRRKLHPGASKEDKLKESCEGFEAIFLNKLWQQMRKTVDQDGYLHSKEEESYVGMFDREMSVKMAEAGGMGLGRQLFEQLRERLTDAGSVTPSIAKRYGVADLNPLHPDPAERDLRLRSDPGELKMPGRPADHGADQAAAMAADLARRIVEQHGVSDTPGLSGPAAAGLLDQAALDEPLPDEAMSDEDAQ